MKTLRRFSFWVLLAAIVSTPVLPVMGLDSFSTAILQDAGMAQDAGAIPTAEEQGGFGFGNLWSLTERAGPLRWPIFAVFIIGLFLVFAKVLELSSDRREARTLQNIDFRRLSLQQIIDVVSSQRESMMSRLHAILLNVYQTQLQQSDLHDEIANFVRYQQDRFDTFKRRVDFLSDTAGALGLLGTVWGIFTVFSQGMLDDQIILTGMGFALITTLLGLIASIVLNLCSTEVFGIFNRRLDLIADKSDELRFRLMELAADEGPVNQTNHGNHSNSNHSFSADSQSPQPVPKGPGSQAAAVSLGAVEPKPIDEVEAAFEDRFSNSQFTEQGGDSAPSAASAPAALPKVRETPAERANGRPVPHLLQLTNAPTEENAGRSLSGLVLKLLSDHDTPLADVQVQVSIREGGGMLNNAEDRIYGKTNDKGQFKFDWHLSNKACTQAIEAKVPGSQAIGTRILHKVEATAGPPRKLKQFGNNQGGEAGHKLPRPFKVQVLDEYDNPISGWPVIFSVEMGGGRLDNGELSYRGQTDNNGEVGVILAVGTEPGFNTVGAQVDGVARELKFQAMSIS